MLDYVILDPPLGLAPYERHRAAAVAGIAEIDDRLANWARTRASARFPIASFFRLRWDETKLKGAMVLFQEFWGLDDVEPKPLGPNAWSTLPVSGYKSAFFNPPHGLSSRVDTLRLFAQINEHIFGKNLADAEIFSWSTDWSNYFDAGHEWWGAFYWTVRPAGAHHMVVIAGSTTD